MSLWSLGLADPSSITSILDQIRTLSGASYDYCGAVCLVDALYFPKYLKLLLALRRQVEYSQAVILNKTDLVDEEQPPRWRPPSGRSTPRPQSTAAPTPGLPAAILSEARREAAAGRPQHRELRPVTVTLSTAEAVSPRRCGAFWRTLPPPPTGSRAFVKPPWG